MDGHACTNTYTFQSHCYHTQKITEGKSSLSATYNTRNLDYIILQQFRVSACILIRQMQTWEYCKHNLIMTSRI